MVTVSTMNHDGVYLPTADPNVFESTALTTAGWYDDGQHGGAVAALVSGHVERTVPTLTPMQTARVTIELFKVVGRVPLKLTTEVVREGKRIQNVRVAVFAPGGELLCLAAIQRLRTTGLELPVERAAFPDGFTLPAESSSELRWAAGHDDTGRRMFHHHAVELRTVHGGFAEPGPGAMWMRLRGPIVAGTDPLPVETAVAAADFGNGISSALSGDWVFMNSDLTVHLGRMPEGEWVALDATSHYEPTGRGIASGSLYDEKGWLGRSTQTLFVDRAP